eukprot:5089978-Pyramimonas_sp.AAC.1
MLNYGLDHGVRPRLLPFTRHSGSGSPGSGSAAASTSAHWSMAHVGSRPGVQVSEAFPATPLLPALSPLCRFVV